MLIRDNKFDEFTLPDKISKINMTHALVRLSASVSRESMDDDQPCPSTPNYVVHTLRTSSAHAQF
jgi:hypothetical protein